MARKTSDERVPCDACGVSFAASHINNHRRRQHGIYLRQSPKRRQQLAAAQRMREAKATKAKATTKAPRGRSKALVPIDRAPAHVRAIATTSPQDSLQMRVLPFVVLESPDGTIWIAQKVTL